MLSTKVVIQKIEPAKGSVTLFQNYDLNTPWHFQSTGDYSSGNKEVFPFVFDGAEHFTIGTAGSETQFHSPNTETILFADDYGVPGGFLIGVLFPEGYMPEIFKFKDKPFIPTGVGSAGTSVSPPGHFELYTNNEARLAAVAFLITSDTYFGFKCIAKNHGDSFKGPDRYPFYSDLFASANFEEHYKVSVNVNDLESFKDHFVAGTKLETVSVLLNNLLSQDLEKGRSEEQTNIITSLKDVISTTSSAVSLSDSYITGNTASLTIAKLLAFAAL